MIRRCSCFVTYGPTPPPVPPTKNCENCFHIPSLVLPTFNSIKPCPEEVGEIDLLENATITVCEKDDVACPITWNLIGEYPYFETLTVTEGILSFSFTSDVPLMDYQNVKIKVHCTCTQHSTIVNVKIGVNNPCLYMVCPEGFVCDPCTETCVEAEIIVEE